jgi:uncharacterized membrane protein
VRAALEAFIDTMSIKLGEESRPMREVRVMIGGGHIGWLLDAVRQLNNHAPDRAHELVSIIRRLDRALDEADPKRLFAKQMTDDSVRRAALRRSRNPRHDDADVDAIEERAHEREYQKRNRDELHLGRSVDSYRLRYTKPGGAFERAFARVWMDERPVLRHILAPRGSGSVHFVEKREAEVAATVIQWLGTNVGFGFLRRALEECGYEVVEKNRHEVRARIQAEELLAMSIEDAAP